MLSLSHDAIITSHDPTIPSYNVIITTNITITSHDVIIMSHIMWHHHYIMWHHHYIMWHHHYIIPWSRVRYGRMDQSLMLLMNKFVLYDPTHLNNALRHLYLHLPLPVGGGQWHTTWHNTRFTLTIAKDVIKIDLICLNQLDASRPFRNCVMLSCWVLVTTHKITWSFHDVELCHLQQVSVSFLS